MTVLCISCDNASKQILYPLFSKHNGPEFLSKMFNEVTGIEFFEYEEIPKHICYTCVDGLRKAYAFRRNCISLYQKRMMYTGKEKLVECSQNSNKTIESSTVIVEHPSVQEYTKIIIKEECKSPPHEDRDDYEAYEVLEDIDSVENNSTALCNEYLLDDSIEFTNDVEVLEVDHTYSKLAEQKSNKPKKLQAASICPKSKENKKSKEKLTLSSDGVKTEYPEDNNIYGRLGSFTVLPSPNNKTLKQTLTDKQCEFCHKEFGSSSERTNHEKIHSAEERPYRCSLESCDKRFKNKYASNQHLSRIHYASKMYQCNLCSKIIVSRSTALLHEMHHFDLRPYQCSYCEKSFHAKNNMQQHMRQHTGEKPMKCHLCPRSFVSPYSLKLHIRVHKQEKPYLCNQCGKTYTSSSQLISHMKRIHTKEKHLKCKDCKAAFFDTTGLNRHVRNHCPINRFVRYRKCDIDQ